MPKGEADDGGQALRMARGVEKFVGGSMEGEPTMKGRWSLFSTALSVAGLAAVMAVLISAPSAVAQRSCSGVQVNPEDPGVDLDAIVNDPDLRATPTTFCVNAWPEGTSATYPISDTLRLRDGDRLIGEEGTKVTLGPAEYGVPKVKIRPSGAPEDAPESIIAAMGKNVQIQWVDISGADGKKTANGNPQTGTGAGITAGSADSGFLVQYAKIHDNDTAGILSAKGRILNNEFYGNTQDPDFLGFNGAAVKGRTEYVAAYNFVHDEQGNGLWCSVGCVNDPARENGFWAHHNLTVDNGRSGIRSETSPNGLGTGVHVSEPTALIEDNMVHGNSYGATRGGISVRDSQNVLIRRNVFGAATVGTDVKVLRTAPTRPNRGRYGSATPGRAAARIFGTWTSWRTN